MSQLTCEVCGKKMKNKSTLNTHLKTHEMVQCDFCRKLYSKVNIKTHLKIHKNRESIKCEICEKDFINKDTLKNHIKRWHESTNREKFKCNNCTKEFVTKTGLRIHMETHDQFRKKYPCEMCGNEY